MGEVVQAACPGCKTVLTIPTEWVARPIRCKHCGTVMQAKQPGQTPAPASRAVLPPPTDRTPVPQLHPASLPPVPLARPVPVVGSPPGSDLFDFSAVSAEARRRVRRRKRAGGWLALALLAGVALLAAGLGVAFWPKIKPIIELAAQGGRPSVTTEGEDSPLPGEKQASAASKAGFPRRALLISVHNYLYANPITEGPTGARTVEELKRALQLGLNIPLPQIVGVSDAARQPRPPLRPVIEQALRNFLQTTRKQDRILVFFIGHTREVGDEPCLVPLEGDFNDAATLIPLKWVYQQLAECPARQKILVLDGNRWSAAQGEERPAAGPMGTRFEAMLRNPPPGVQVLASCTAAQQSHEFDATPLGLFLESFRRALAQAPPPGFRSALAGRIQKPDDLIPLDGIARAVEENMDRVLEKYKLKQTPLVSGAAPASGAEYDRAEPPASVPAIPVPALADSERVRGILDELSLPPLRPGERGDPSRLFTHLPPFPPDALKPYEGASLPPDSKLRDAIHQARITLWALSSAEPPKDLAAQVQAYRTKTGLSLEVLNDRYKKPAGGVGETRFKDRIVRDSTAIARLVARLENVRDQLKEDDVVQEKEKAPKRWQANYTFVLARTLAQLAYLEEHNGLLGQLRREYPPHDPEVHTGWRMASREKASDSVGKKLERELRKLYDSLARQHRGTPWEVLARREGLTRLGLEWQPTN